MTTLAEMMLEVARFVTIVSSGTATSGSTSTLLDTLNLLEPGDYWGGGTLFLGTCAQTTMSGKVIPILQFGENKLTFATQTATITLADPYSVVHGDYKRLELKNAVLGVLRSRNAQMYNAATAIVASATSYSLPTGVKGIRRVMVDGAINQHWHEINGKLEFPTKYIPTGTTIQLIYCAPQGDIAESATIDPSYNYDGLKWSSVVNLMRATMQKIGKDDPVLLDLLNEAKTMEQQAWGRAQTYLPTDVRLA